MPDFTRRHYEAIADVLAHARLTAYSSTTPVEDSAAAGTAIADVATKLAGLFERDNPNFNRVRFFLAADCEDQK